MEQTDQMVELMHNSQFFKRQVPMQSSNFAHPSQFNQHVSNSAKFRQPMFSGVDERSHKISRLRQGLESDQPHPSSAGNGVYSFNMHELSKMLIAYIFKERELEAIKVELVKRPDFNLIDFFKLLDWRSQGALSPSDILQSLKAYLDFSKRLGDWQSETTVNTKQQHMFFLLYRRYDLNLDSFLDFTEFCQMIMPRNTDLAAIIANRPDYYMHRKELPLDNYFNLDTKFDICKLMEQLLINEYEYERLRNQLRALTYFTFEEAFNHMDYDCKGYLLPEDFNRFLQTKGVFRPTDIDITALFAKFDVMGREKVRMADFKEELTPKLPK